MRREPVRLWRSRHWLPQGSQWQLPSTIVGASGTKKKKEKKKKMQTKISWNDMKRLGPDPQPSRPTPSWATRTRSQVQLAELGPKLMPEPGVVKCSGLKQGGLLSCSGFLPLLLGMSGLMCSNIASSGARLVGSVLKGGPACVNSESSHGEYRHAPYRRRVT